MDQFQLNNAARVTRIEQLFTRGIEIARRAYDSGKYLDEYGHHEIDRIVLGMHLPLAHALLRVGDPASKIYAEKIIRQVLDKQELHPHHPHRGNWPRWMDDEEITDLNSAPFILRWLIPLLVEHQHQLSDDLLTDCRHSLHLALDELERMDVSFTYTNIHLMTIFALIVGGEWLEDQHFQEIGKIRWRRWVRFTVGSGAPREYNSLTYLGMDLTVLAKMQQMAKDSAIRLQARIIYERFWLHVVIHFHRPTRQLAGPHARSYWAPMITGRERLTEILWRETGWAWILKPSPYENSTGEELPVNLELALTDFWLPDFVSAWLNHQQSAFPYDVRETASREEGYDLTTYYTSDYALGSASCTYSTGTGILAIEQMANHLILHYLKPDQPGGWGLAYSRYVVNNQHWGTLGSFPFRPNTNFFDQGNFASVQLHNKVICLYTLLPLNDTYVNSLKTVIAFQSGDAVERIWVNGKSIPIEETPGIVQQGDWIVVEDGGVYVGIWTLEVSVLSRDAPIQLERGPLGELWLSVYNYKGVSKRFWDYASLGGAYWRGNLKAGFILEVAQRSEYPSAADFLDHLKLAEIKDQVTDHIRSLVYRSGGDELSLDYDLWNTSPKERYLNEVVYTPPNLTSPLGVQGDSGELHAGRARIVTKPQQVWLIAQDFDTSQQTWIAVNPEDCNTPLLFETPCGVVTADQWGMGRLEWRASLGENGTLIVDTLCQPKGLKTPEGMIIQFTNEGRTPIEPNTRSTALK